MIEAINLSKTFGQFRAVDRIAFTVRRGDVLGFLGPNGAGKSTTMKMLTGYLPPSAGVARIGGIDVASDPVAAKRLFGYLPESSPVYPEMTVTQFLWFVAGVRGRTGSARQAAVARAIERCHLGDVRDQVIETLSKGYRQRVGLAQAIVDDPPVLILDEPTDGLDPNQKHEVRRLITAMAADKAILLSTHILEEVEAVCTRIIIVAGGRVLVDETPAALRARDPLGRLDTVFRDLTSAPAGRHATRPASSDSHLMSAGQGR